MRAAKLREPFVFLIDECLRSASIRDALTAACVGGETIKMMPPGTLDEEWLPEAGREGWLCFSKDRRMTQRPNEEAAILEHNVGLFTLGEASGAEHAQLLVQTLPIVRRAARLLRPAFVARIERTGSLLVTYREGERLRTAQPIKPQIGEWGRPDKNLSGHKPR